MLPTSDQSNRGKRYMSAFIYTVYKITNIVNGMIYVGVHKTTNPNDYYLGSGTHIKNAIEKYGRENFTKEILHEYKYEKVAYRKEAEIVNEDFVRRKDTYNLKEGGNYSGPLLKEPRIAIKEFKNIHGDKYDYNKMKYLGGIKNIEIICPIHGSFFQTPSNHKQYGCSKCLTKKRISEYGPKCIKDFQEIHGDKYDYSLVEYINTKTKVRIICPEHGVFVQTPNNHKNGQSCPKCVLLEATIRNKHAQEKVIEEFKKVHGDKYDYSLVDYVTTNVKVEIKCLKHGLFWQRPSIHKKGANCPECKRNYK